MIHVRQPGFSIWLLDVRVLKQILMSFLFVG